MSAKTYRRVNDGFPDALQAALSEKFGLQVEVRFNICDMCFVIERADGGPLSSEERICCEAFMAGYLAAMDLCR